MVITNNALNAAISNTITELGTLFSHMAVGDNNTTPTEADTTLGNETLRETIFKENLLSTEIRVDLRLDTTENNGNTIKEVGVFDAGAGGTMYVRDLTTELVKTVLREAYYQEVVRFQSSSS